MLPCRTPICPHHTLAAVFILAPHSHLCRIVASHFTGLEVAADSFLLLCGFHHCVPLVFYLFFILSTTSTVAPHRALGLQSSVALLRSPVGHLGGRRVDMCVGLLLVCSFPLTFCTVLVGASQGGRIYLNQTTSGSHIVQHVDTGGHSRVHPFPFHVGRGHVTCLKAMTIGDYHFPIWMLRRPLLPPPLAAAWLHLTVFSQVFSKIISVGADKLVCVLVVNSVYWGCRGLFWFTSVEAVWCNGSSEYFILGDET